MSKREPEPILARIREFARSPMNRTLSYGPILASVLAMVFGCAHDTAEQVPSPPPDRNAGKSYIEELEPSEIKWKMVFIPGGRFMMGAGSAASADRPPRMVEVS